MVDNIRIPRTVKGIGSKRDEVTCPNHQLDR